MIKEITLINKRTDANVTLTIPYFVYTNYVLTGDKAEIDWWLKESNLDIDYNEIIVDEIDHDFMVLKENELRKLMGKD